MSGGDIAAIIAASAFALLVIALVPTLVKLAKLVDDTRTTVQEINDNLGPLLTELTETIAVVNNQVTKIDAITSSVKNVAGNIERLVEVFATALGSPLLKIAGLSRGLYRFLNKQKNGRKSQDD